MHKVQTVMMYLYRFQAEASQMGLSPKCSIRLWTTVCEAVPGHFYQPGDAWELVSKNANCPRPGFCQAVPQQFAGMGGGCQDFVDDCRSAL